MEQCFYHICKFLHKTPQKPNFTLSFSKRFALCAKLSKCFTTFHTQELVEYVNFEVVVLKNTGERLYGTIFNCWQTTAEFCLLLQVVVLSAALVLIFALGRLVGLLVVQLVDLKQL